MVLLIIVVSFLLNQKTLKILRSKLQNVHVKRFPECKRSTKLKIDIQCHLEYIRNCLCTCLPCRDQDFKKCQTISTYTFRTSPEIIRFHWFTYKHKKGDESDSDSDATLDDDDIANSDGVISESISSLLQVGDITVVWADDPVLFFYLIKVTQ